MERSNILIKYFVFAQETWLHIHEKEKTDADGKYLCATSDENAKEAAALLGDNGRLEEVKASYHEFHSRYVDEYVNIINSLQD